MPVGGTFRLNSVTRCLASTLMLMIFSADAREYLFSPSSLEGDMLTQQDIDLSLFTKSDAQLPGTYSSIITINDRRLKDANIRYVSRSDGRLIPQLSPAMLRAWGINIDRYPPLLKRPAEETLPESLDNYIPQASAELDFSTMTLRLSIPQAALADNGRDFIDSSRWDDGVPVLFSD